MEKEKRYTELYTGYYKKVWQTAYRYTNCHSSADDITQEVFIKLWLHFDTCKKVADMPGYLFIITRNCSFSYCKANGVRKRKLRNYVESVSIVQKDDWVIHRETDRILMQMISGLPEREKRIFTLVVDLGNKRDVVADYLKVSPNTIKSTIHKVRRKFSSRVNRGIDFNWAPKAGKPGKIAA